MSIKRKSNNNLRIRIQQKLIISELRQKIRKKRTKKKQFFGHRSTYATVFFARRVQKTRMKYVGKKVRVILTYMIHLHERRWWPLLYEAGGRSSSINHLCGSGTDEPEYDVRHALAYHLHERRWALLYEMGSRVAPL